MTDRLFMSLGGCGVVGMLLKHVGFFEGRESGAYAIGVIIALVASALAGRYKE